MPIKYHESKAHTVVKQQLSELQLPSATNADVYYCLVNPTCKSNTHARTRTTCIITAN